MKSTDVSKPTPTPDDASTSEQLDMAVNRIIRTLRGGRPARLKVWGQSPPERSGPFSPNKMTVEELGRLIERSLKRSKAIEIDGLGVFARSNAGDISFEPSNKLRVFIAYAVEDREMAERLYDGFAAHGLSAWLDRRKLLPGQDWPQRIEDAIASSDFFIACFSKRSVNKRGGFQTELRYALDCANRMPLDDVFLIPLRLEECRIPARIQRETQYVDLYPDWQKGFDSILKIIDRQTRKA